MWVSGFFCQGFWSLFQPPGYRGDTDYFVKWKDNGRLYSASALFGHLFFLCPAQAFLASSESIYAPEELEVVAVEDGQPSRAYFNFFVDLFRYRPTDKAQGQGNWIRLRKLSGEEIIFKHLEPGINWQAGQCIGKGEQIAKIGASGLCLMPCLAVQVVGVGVRRLSFVDIQLRSGEKPQLYQPKQAQVFSSMDSGLSSS